MHRCIKCRVSQGPLIVLVGLALCLGCSKGPSYAHGSAVGIVTVDGKPAPHGAIRFNPKSNGQGAMVGADIEEGHYRCEVVPTGDVTVTFTLHDAGLRKFVDGTGVPREVPIDILPPQYRAGVPAMVHEGENQLDFALTAKAGR